MASVTVYYRKPKDIPAICATLAEHYGEAAQLSASLAGFRERILGKTNWRTVWTDLGTDELARIAQALDPTVRHSTWRDAFTMPGAEGTKPVRLALFAPRSEGKYLACSARTQLSHLHERFRWLAHYSNLLETFPSTLSAGDFVLFEHLIETAYGDPAEHWRGQQEFVFHEMPYTRKDLEKAVALYEAERVASYGVLYRTLNELVVKPLSDASIEKADVRPVHFPQRMKGPGFTGSEIELLAKIPALPAEFLAESMHEQVKERMLNNYRQIQDDVR